VGVRADTQPRDSPDDEPLLPRASQPNIRSMDPTDSMAQPATDPAHPGRRFRFTLTHQILLGLVVGCLIGALAPSFAKELGWISQLFLRLIKMVLAPLLVTTLVAGVAGAGSKMVGRLAVKAITWFLVATTVALLIGLVAANLVQPGAGVTGAVPVASKLGQAKSATEFVLDAIPISMFDAMAQNKILQIVVFSVFLGLAISAAGARARILIDFAEAGAEAMFKLVGFVMRFAPFGVGAAIAVTLGANGLGVLLPLAKCIAALYASLLVFFALLFIATKLVTRAHMPTFLRAIREPALIAFTTASSEAAMPRAMQALEQLGVPRKIVGFVVPTGYSFNLDGSTLYLSLALMFVAQAGGIQLSWSEQVSAMLVLMLASKGLAGVPRAALVVLAGTVTDLRLPDHGVAILLGIDAIMDMGRTCVNVVGNCVATLAVAVWEKAVPATAPVFHPAGTAAPLAIPPAEVIRE
jgi:proton glutamate symport protein